MDDTPNEKIETGEGPGLVIVRSLGILLLYKTGCRLKNMDPLAGSSLVGILGMHQSQTGAIHKLDRNTHI